MPTSTVRAARPLLAWPGSVFGPGRYRRQGPAGRPDVRQPAGSGPGQRAFVGLVLGHDGAVTRESRMPAPSPDPGLPDASRHEAAAEFLQSLPAPWALGPISAHRLAPELLERCDATGWALDDRLRRKLTSRPVGVRDFAAVLVARVRDLTPPDSPTAPKPRKPCTRCGSLRSLMHGRTVCVACVTASPTPSASDPATRKAEVLAALRNARRAS